VKRRALLLIAGVGAFSLCGSAHAFELPAVCATAAKPPPGTDSLSNPELRRRVEAESEIDPATSVSILCATIPRIARQYGEQSPELAWWVKSLTMPMIAYMDRFEEAKPLLGFAQRILERADGTDGEELADIHVAYAWIDTREGHYADAAAAWERALTIRRRFPGAKKVELQKALVGLALVRLNQGNLRAARVAVEEARGIAVEYHEQVSEASAAIENVLTNISFREENFKEAKRHAEAQLAIEKKLQAGIGQFVPGYVFLGQILERLADFPGSEAASREAIRLAETQHGGPLQRHQLTALTQLANLLNSRGRPREALDFAKQAVALGERTLEPDAPRMVKPLEALADSERALGDLPDAWHLYERIDSIVKRHEADIERPVLVAYYRGRAGLELELGNQDDAVSALTAGLAVARAEPTLVLQRAYLTATLGEVSALSDADRARGELDEARRLFAMRLPDSHPAILRVINERCGLEIVAREPTRSCAAARRRVSGRTEVEPALRAAVFDNLSTLEQSRGRLAAASQFAVSAMAAAEGSGMPEPLRKSYFRAAQVLQARAQPELAIFFGKRAISAIEQERRRFTGEDERFDRGFLRDKIAVYRSVADWLLDAGRIDEAIEVMQLLKEEELADFLSRAAPPGAQGLGPTLTSQEQALESAYIRALSRSGAAGAEIDRLSRMQDKERITDPEKVRLAELARREQEREGQTARRIAEFLVRGAAPSSSGAPRTARRLETARLREEIAVVPAHTAIAYYLLTEKRLRILIAAHDLQSELDIAVNAVSLQRQIGRFLEQISLREDVTASAHALYAVLGRPLDEIARRNGITRLALWLDGPLRYVPFGALLADDGYLADHYAVQMIIQRGARSSAGLRPVGSASAVPPIVRGLGVTRAIAGFPALPGMADELCYVVRGPIVGLAQTSAACSQPAASRGALDGEGFADTAFTAERLESLLRPPHAFTVLHLGTHFSLRPGNINRSFLLLGDGTRLTLDALSTLDFSGLDIVTLSACQTAVGGGESDDGREIEGLSAVVQERGARQVVATLWKVEDASTAELMHALYSRLTRPRTDLATALEHAQREIRTRVVDGTHPYSHPYYWAGFVVSGELQ